MLVTLRSSNMVMDAMGNLNSTDISEILGASEVWKVFQQLMTREFPIVSPSGSGGSKNAVAYIHHPSDVARRGSIQPLNIHDQLWPFTIVITGYNC